jgi:hypothetical protein
MLDEPKERNILKLILIVRFACATLDAGHPIHSVVAFLHKTEWTELVIAHEINRVLGENTIADSAVG